MENMPPKEYAQCDDAISINKEDLKQLNDKNLHYIMEKLIQLSSFRVKKPQA